MNINDKRMALINYFKDLGKVAIAFSGGTDSSLLVKVAMETLGAENVLAVTVRSPLIPNRELDESVEFCKAQGVEHIVIDANVLDIEEVRSNAPNRCYACKYTIFKGLILVAKRKGIVNICEGSNADDVNDYRPGFKAVVELGVKSPLLELGITKNDVRQMLKDYGLSVWNKPSFACLASRFAYGEIIDDVKLKMVENAEQYLFDLGYNQFRVRIHGDLARVEVNHSDFDRIINDSDRINSRLKTLGFNYVSLDLQGYRTGSMNEVL